MPTYEYGCKGGHRVQMVHGFGDNPDVRCSICKEPMHRIPQLFRWYKNPGMVLLDHMDDKYREYRGKVKRRKQWQRQHKRNRSKV